MCDVARVGRSGVIEGVISRDRRGDCGGVKMGILSTWV